MLISQRVKGELRVFVSGYCSVPDRWLSRHKLQVSSERFVVIVRDTRYRDCA
jgi:hypothetical protein